MARLRTFRRSVSPARTAPLLLGMTLSLAAAGNLPAATGAAIRRGDRPAAHAKSVAPAPVGRFFRVGRRDGVWWFLTPRGEPFFSAGADVVDRGLSPARYDLANPAYASFRYNPDDGVWARRTTARLRAWNFNTLGAWSDVATLDRARQLRMPYAPVLHLGDRTGVPWCDMFAPAFERDLDRFARPLVLPYKDDPRLLGWFTDNELGWWEDTLFVYFLDQPPENATRARLIRLLREQYRGDFTLLRRDFATGEAPSFEALRKVTLKPGGKGRHVLRRFAGLLAERYYASVVAAVRRYDPNHLLLGDRYANFYPFSVARSAGRHMDVVSTNFSCPGWPDGDLARFFLDGLHGLTGKPVLVSEYYAAAMENRSGDRNPDEVFPTVKTQADRARRFRATLSAFAARPYFVGAHWFQYYDEPLFGREDGENYNMGLVDIQDRPYERLTRAARSLQGRIGALHRRALLDAQRRPVAGIPPAPPHPLDGLAMWDKARGWAAPATPLPYADLYACWKRRRLYLALYTSAFFDPGLYPGGAIPAGEQLEWTLRFKNGSPPLRVRFGPGGRAGADRPGVIVKGSQQGTRYSVVVALPSTLFGSGPLHPNARIALDATLRHPGQAGEMAWKREFLVMK